MLWQMAEFPYFLWLSRTHVCVCVHVCVFVYVYMYIHTFFIHSSIDEYLGYFHILAIVNNAVKYSIIILTIKVDEKLITIGNNYL